MLLGYRCIRLVAACYGRFQGEVFWCFIVFAVSLTVCGVVIGKVPGLFLVFMSGVLLHMSCVLVGSIGLLVWSERHLCYPTLLGYSLRGLCTGWPVVLVSGFLDTGIVQRAP